MNNELKAKYARIANDPSQLEMFKNDVIDGVIGGGSVEIAGTSLVIPAQPGPESVVTIDGVKYYHKHEFDLEELVTTYRYLDPITGEDLPSDNPSYPYTALHGTSHSGGAAREVSFIIGRNASPFTFVLFTTDETAVTVNFTSRAFTPVDSFSEVTDNTKICLPTCSAYYGFLSEDGKTFISYFNLKSEGAAEYVDSIKQGNVIIPLKDMSAGGGLKLYQHDITVPVTYTYTDSGGTVTQGQVTIPFQVLANTSDYDNTLLYNMTQAQNNGYTYFSNNILIIPVHGTRSSNLQPNPASTPRVEFTSSLNGSLADFNEPRVIAAPYYPGASGWSAAFRENCKIDTTSGVLITETNPYISNIVVDVENIVHTVTEL